MTVLSKSPKSLLKSGRRTDLSTISETGICPFCDGQTEVSFRESFPFHEETHNIKRVRCDRCGYDFEVSFTSDNDTTNIEHNIVEDHNVQDTKSIILASLDSESEFRLSLIKNLSIEACYKIIIEIDKLLTKENPWELDDKKTTRLNLFRDAIRERFRD